MEIQTLRLFISEAEANELIAHHQPPDVPVKNLQVEFTAEGVRISGEYPTLLMNMPFETLWQLAVNDGRVEARLVDLSAAKLPAGPLRSVVLRALGDHIAEPGVSATDEAIVLDVRELVRRQKPPVRLDFAVQAVTCTTGGLIVEAGWPF
jgi:hypothetical protein